MISTAVLSLALVVAAPAFAQEQHEQEEQKAKPAAHEEKKAQPEKSAKQERSLQRSGEKVLNLKRRTQNKQRRTRSRHRRIMHSNPARRQSRRWPHSAGPFRGQFRTATHVSRQPGRLQESPLSIRRLLVRVCRSVAQQLAIHARRFCCRHKRSLLPVQCGFSRRQHCAQLHIVGAVRWGIEMNSRQGAKYAWNYIYRDFGSGVFRCPAALVAQPTLGLGPTGGIGLILFIVVILLVLGRI